MAKINPTNEQGIVHDARFLLGLRVTDTGSYPTADIIRNVNAWYRKANSWIWNATRLWEYDDTNYTDLPIATANLVAEQQDYELPSTAQKIIRVEIKNNNGDWYQLDQIDQSQISEAMSEYYETPGAPLSYDLIGRSLFLYPKPKAADVTLVAGLKLYFSRDVNEFSITDTSTEPGFTDNFHRLLSLGGAVDYAISKGMTDKINILRAEITEMKEELERFYGFRNLGKRLKINPSGEGIIGQI